LHDAPSGLAAVLEIYIGQPTTLAPIVAQASAYAYHEVKLCWFFTQYFYFYLA